MLGEACTGLFLARAAASAPKCQCTGWQKVRLTLLTVRVYADLFFPCHREMVECFNKIAQDSECHAVVVSGSGKIFTAGRGRGVEPTCRGLPRDQGWHNLKYCLRSAFSALQFKKTNRNGYNAPHILLPNMWEFRWWHS